jgi:hypothetical protein
VPGSLKPAQRSTPAAAREVFGPPRRILAWRPELPGAGRSAAVEGGIRVSSACRPREGCSDSGREAL